MKPYNIAFLSCRILALWVFVQLVLSVAVTLNVTSELVRYGDIERPSSFVLPVLGFLPPILRISVGILLWWKADWFATRMTSGIATADDSPSEPITTRLVLTIALPIVGFLILPSAIYELSTFIAEVLANRHDELSQPGLSSSSASSAVLIGALSAWLIFSSRGFAAAITRLRSHDANAPSTDDQK